ncbi:Lrp/AsnC family transcriptional regulator [Alicyclobacillus mali]|uniref:Lrp/AsnC family transcriptional regulator n=1 Tax=Alicyclobacillus mali (ex Roth et al. 2021) TaxID=1123961 RepID=A0ABS0F508_9BACL|nr:Lrp/AsnC family transcriptional regulator [Alicyclobacillus mali (ex Roth et al. 2021)]MBF8378385.1 Lrp/AsnC family transcriptional regulator [Alicyclobacillus mali (ex Roth et al. 2021)]MCL6489302.1 Lrp/AsnC family transcriptional regulator [Alicyclobacillus mali (ex Roth et al. 2021)]
MNDALRLKICDLLHENAKLSPETIARMLGETPDVIESAIRELEQEKIILRYSAVVNWDKLPVNQVTAVIDVKVLPQREVGFDAIARKIYRFDEVKSVALMSGGYDLQVTVVGRDIREVSRFVSEKLATLENVTSTATHFLLKTYKSDGVIYDDTDGERRLMITP